MANSFKEFTVAVAALSIIGLSSTAELSAQDHPRFDAADVHISPPSRNPYTLASGGILMGGRYDLLKATMLDLITRAWNADPDTVFGGPNWLELDRFDVSAKAPPRTAPETLRIMLQTLLKERFDLAVHNDTRLLPAYALHIGKGGKPNLRKSDGDANPACEYQATPESVSFGNVACRNMTMNAFAQWLRQNGNGYIRVPVTDATGLDGSWDFELRWNWRNAILPAGAQRLTLIDAVEKLGLSLTLETAPAPVLVVDRANEKPSPNPRGVEKLLPPRPVQFEVADLKLSRPDEQVYTNFYPGGRLELRDWDLKTLIGYAFDMDWDHMNDLTAGIPAWAESTHIDINAKSPAEAFGPVGPAWANDDLRVMTRNLLIERFRIRFHYEDRPITAYTLVAAKPKMKRADPSHRPNCKEARIVANDPRESNPMLSRLLECQNVTMKQFADQLQNRASDEFAVPVEDATGLGGAFDFTLSFTPIGIIERTQPANNTGNSPGASEPSGAISVYDAVSKQLGLKLEKRKRMLPVLVIDHMEQKPSEN